MSGPTINRGESSGDIWTPEAFRTVVNVRFGPVVWDLAASAANSFVKSAPWTDRNPWFDEAEDSLAQDWHRLKGPLWLNPPFGNITPWARKCMEEWKAGAEILLLVPMGSQNWYWDYVEQYAQVYCVGRMVFDNCFDKRGELVTTTYPKDLILAHYLPGKHGNRPQRWRWNDQL